MKPRQLSRTWFCILITLVLAALLTPALSLSAYAEGEVRQATSLLDFANATVADLDNATYLVDKQTGEVNDGESFVEVFGEEFPGGEIETLGAIEEDGDYLVTNEDDDTYYVSSTFGCKRLLVNATLTSLYGAEKGVTFEGDTILQFATEEATEAAYNELVELYGAEAVMPDFVVWAMEAHGWGTATMGMDVQTPKIENYINAGTVSGDKVVVAVTDSGINPNHEIFANCTISSKSTVIGSAGSSYIDDDGHGTMTAGIIAESCPTNIEIMAVKVLNSEGSGSTTDCLNGIRYATRNGANVINCSWGGKGSSTSYSYQSYMKNMDTYCKEAYDQNILICASAGNDGQDMDEASYTYTKNGVTTTINNPRWLPSECQYVICVGSVDSTNVDSTGQKSSFSNYGDAIEFTAPGRQVELALYNNDTGYRTANGTSFSAPYVSAACALLKEYNRNISFTDAVNALASMSRDFGAEGWDRTFGYGMPVFTENEPLGHVWDTENVTWNWTGDDTSGYTAASATIACKIDPEHTQTQEAIVTSDQNGTGTTYTATAELAGTTYTDSKATSVSPEPQSDPASLYLAFGSDRHTVTTAIGTAMAGMPQGVVSYMGLLGDMASDTTDSTSAVLNEVIAALGNQLNATNVDDIYGNHDENMVRDTDPDIINVDSSGSSGLVYTSLDDAGNVQYYVWGIAYDDLVAKHNEQGTNNNYHADVAAGRAQAFKEWVSGVDPTIPIIVLSHAPLHAKRGDNYSGAVWNEALNYAATGMENVGANDTNCEITRNVIFMHGHNHTSESALRNYLPYNPEDANTSGSRAVSFQSGSSSTVTTPIYYSYMTAGYMSVRTGNSGAYNNNASHSTLMEITDDQLKFYLFPAANLQSAEVRQTVNRVVPAYEAGQLMSITVDASGAKTAYEVGEALDLSGLVVTANYYGADSAAVTDYTTNAETAVDLTTAGTYTVTVSYTEGDVTKTATFEVTVTNPYERDVYVLADALETGCDYLIVNSGAAGTGYALGQASGGIVSDEVTVLAKDSLTDDNYIAAEDVDATSVWHASDSDGRTKLTNGGRYLQITGSSGSYWGTTTYTLSAATSESNDTGTWAYGSGALSYQYTSSSWWSTTTNTAYVTFANGGFVAASNSAEVYLYKKTTINLPAKYTVTFVDEDGQTVLLAAAKYEEGTPAASIVQPETPTKEPTAEFSYEFAGWDPELADVTGNVTYRATYTATTRTYGITWVDGNGRALRTDEVAYGETPAFDGVTPTKDPTVSTVYTFNGTWSPEIVPVAGDATYTAQFDEAPRMYTVTFVDEDETQISSATYAYGTPAADITLPDNPTKEATAEFSYEFAGWDPEVADVAGDATYTATYTATKRSYLITWLGDGDATLKTEQVEYGETPAYEGDDPTKPQTDQFTYTFTGWDPEVAPVTGEATYRATFSQATRTYRVTFVDEDGTTVLKEAAAYEYGTPAASIEQPEEPTKTATAEFSYAFAGWEPQIADVTGDAIYKATYTATTRTYGITWVDGNGRTLRTDEVAYGETPAFDGVTPTKDPTVATVYTFNGTWSPEIVPVAGDATYTAQFDEAPRMYQVTFVDEDGETVLKEATEYAYGTPAAEVSRPADPTKGATAGSAYIFAGWSPEVAEVTEDATYMAIYNEIPLPDGWVDLGSSRRGYARDGRLVTGWLTLDGAKYWFAEDGAAVSGWQEIGGQDYYFRTGGDYRMASGWATIDDQKLLFRADGRLAQGWVTLDGASYYADAGVPREGWQEIDDGKRYFRPAPDYRMATGRVIVDGEELVFDSLGRLVEG